MYTSATREKAPIWLFDIKDDFVIRSLGVWSDGKTSEGKVLRSIVKIVKPLAELHKKAFTFMARLMVVT